MKKIFSFLLLLCLAVSCHTTKTAAKQPEKKSVVASHSGNGTSFADAVIITEKKNEPALEAEMKAWLAEKYPGYVLLSSRSESMQSEESKQQYRIYKIRGADAAEFEVFFDVSIFYNGQIK